MEFIVKPPISSLIVISRPTILGGPVVVLVSVVGVEDGCGGVEDGRGGVEDSCGGVEDGRGGVVEELEMVVLIGLVTTPGDIRLDELERLADIDRRDRGSVTEDWEILIELVTTPGAMRLDELEGLGLADIEGKRGVVVVDWEMLIEFVTTPGGIGLDELERPADIERRDRGGVVVDWEMPIELVTTPRGNQARRA